jgi:hypothetical protein
VHAARRHAVVRRLDNHADALRFQDVIDGVCGEISLPAPCSHGIKSRRRTA